MILWNRKSEIESGDPRSKPLRRKRQLLPISFGLYLRVHIGKIPRATHLQI